MKGPIWGPSEEHTSNAAFTTLSDAAMHSIMSTGEVKISPGKHFLQDTRELLLKLRPNTRKNWISLAVAYHLNGNLQNAKKVLENYSQIVKVRVNNLFFVIFLY